MITPMSPRLEVPWGGLELSVLPRFMWVPHSHKAHWLIPSHQRTFKGLDSTLKVAYPTSPSL